MNTKEGLIQTAEELFSRRGYEGTGTQEIVRAAGITKPTLYHFFGSKEGLLRAVLDRGEAALEERTGEALEYGGDVTATLEAVVRGFFALAREEPRFSRLFLQLFAAPADSGAAQAAVPLFRRLTGRTEELFRRAAEDHGNMRGREKLYAAGFLGLIYSYTGLHLRGEIELNEELVHRTAKHFMHGIFS